MAQGSAKEAARELGDGWKVNPYIDIPAGETLALADISGSGAINHIWMPLTESWRYSILRIYWEGQEKPSVECPAGVFSDGLAKIYANQRFAGMRESCVWIKLLFGCVLVSNFTTNGFSATAGSGIPGS